MLSVFVFWWRRRWLRFLLHLPQDHWRLIRINSRANYKYVWLSITHIASHRSAYISVCSFPLLFSCFRFWIIFSNKIVFRASTDSVVFFSLHHSANEILAFRWMSGWELNIRFNIKDKWMRKLWRWDCIFFCACYFFSIIPLIRMLDLVQFMRSPMCVILIAVSSVAA